MGKRSRRSFDRFFLLMIMISCGGWLLWVYGIPFIQDSIKTHISTRPSVEPTIVPPVEVPPVGPTPVPPVVDTQAIVDTVMTVLLWALGALVVFGLIRALWRNREKLFGQGSFSSLIETIRKIFGKISDDIFLGGEKLHVVYEWTWNPRIMSGDAASRLWMLMLAFEPQNHDDERGFHEELYNWLRKDFPQAECEKPIGKIRVDIAVGKIAIEVKGPKENTGYRSISEQALTRLNYYDNVIFALFKPQFTGPRFDEVEKAIKRELPKVGVITYGL